MKICVIGTSFAPKIFRKVWPQLGFTIVKRPQSADLVFVSQDTKIAPNGKRRQDDIAKLVRAVYNKTTAPIVLTSQVEPGFTRSLGLPIYHMAETLRVKDAKWRAFHPDYLAIGCADPYAALPKSLVDFITTFEKLGAPAILCSLEEAEFSKIAVNMTLASQVENANRLSKAAKKVGADWNSVMEIIGHDKRIGNRSYLSPGKWRDSKHLLRDYYTLNKING